jgi:hypothetical protein
MLWGLGYAAIKAQELSPEQLFSQIAILVTAGNATEAKSLALANPVEPPADSQADERYGTYLLHLGWIELSLGDHPKAIEHLEASRTFWPDSLWLSVYLLQSCHALNRADCVWNEFTKIPEWYLAQQDGLALIASESAKNAGQPQRSWDILNKMRILAPESKRIFAARIDLMGRLGLGSELRHELHSTFAKGFQPDLNPDDYGNMLSNLLALGYNKEVLEILEPAFVRFPQNASLRVLQGITYNKSGEDRLGAESLSVAASLDPKFAHDASLLLSRVGEFELALAYNSNVPDRVKKLEQRAILYLQLRDYQRLAALERPLAGAGLLERDDLRYALAFAHYQSGGFQHAMDLLQGISDSKLFERATQLRADIAKQCQDALRAGCR